MADPRAVIAAPIYNQETLIESAVGSLIAQARTDFALVLVDDCSTDRTGELARELAAQDPRVTYIRNPRRLGMLENTRLAVRTARERHASADYIALGSDHDWWHPDWLGELVDALDGDPDAVLAYPLVERVALSGEVTREPWHFDTAGVDSPRRRMRAAFRGSAGEMIYGLFRASVLDRVGMYRSVLVPDRLLLAELALHGTFRQVERVLWRRRLAVVGDMNRQRSLFFLDGIPWHARGPWLPTHVAVLMREYWLRGHLRSHLDGTTRAMVPFDYAGMALWRQLRAWLVETARRNARRPAVRARLVRMRPPPISRVEWAYEKLLDDGRGAPPASACGEDPRLAHPRR